MLIKLRLHWLFWAAAFLSAIGITPSNAQDGTPPTAQQENSSASSQSSSEKPIYTDKTDRDNQLLAKANPLEIRWLSTDTEKLIVLFKAGETRKIKGTLLMLHASDSPQRWPESLEELRRNLPLYGWSTYAVPLPPKAQPKIPDRSSSMPTEIQASSETSESISSAATSSASSSQRSSLNRDQQISARVDSAIQDLNKMGVLNIVVLTDNSAAPEALNGLFAKINIDTSNIEAIDGPIQAVVLTNLQEQEPLTTEQLSKIFSIEKLPTFDIFIGSNEIQIKTQRRIHKAEAMRKNLLDYRQYVLAPEPATAVNESARFWVEQVRGFLEQKAQGNEFANPQKK